MSDGGFAAFTTQSERGSVIELRGVVNRAAKEELESSYRRAAEADREIVFDFSEVEYINSTGIAVIVGVLAMARSEGREIGAVGLSPHYVEVFRITRLADFMHIYEDTAAGI